MAKIITCRCLNVNINESSNEQIDRESFQISDGEKNDPFFKQDIRPVFALKISVEQNSLVQSRIIGRWCVYHCSNCGLDVYATGTDNCERAITVVSPDLLVNANEIAALRKSGQYSAVFRILVDEKDTDINFDKSKAADLLLTRRDSGNNNKMLADLQQQLTEAIRCETQATEDRIRRYTEQQYVLLEEFRERTRRDHRVLTRLILSNQAASSPVNSVPSKGSERLETPPSTADMYSSSGNSSPIIIAANKRPVTKPKHSLLTSLNSHAKRSSRNHHITNKDHIGSYDSETLFQLEGMDDGFVPHRTSDLDSDTDDSVCQDEAVYTPRQKMTANIAKSLPVNVPTFMTSYSRSTMEFDDDLPPEDPLDIAASIKALAKSVHGDAVFGDLPRPRFSTQI